jgi:hypothetical protein
VGWSGAVIHGFDRPSPGDLRVGQHEQGAQQGDGVLGVQTQLGQDAPVLQVGEAVLVGRALPTDQLVRLLLGLWDPVGRCNLRGF